MIIGPRLPRRCYWLPLQAITFSVVPPHLRVLWVSIVSTGYVTVLSYVTQALDNVQKLLPGDTGPEK